MTVCVISLDDPLTESMVEGNDQGVVIRDPDCAQFCYTAESWVRAWSDGRARTQCGGKRAETPSVCRRILKWYVNTMMAEVPDAQISACSEGLLQFEIPLLIL